MIFFTYLTKRPQKDKAKLAAGISNTQIPAMRRRSIVQNCAVPRFTPNRSHLSVFATPARMILYPSRVRGAHADRLRLQKYFFYFPLREFQLDDGLFDRHR